MTQVLPKEIQVRFNSGENLMYGKIFPLTDHQKKNLFNILYKRLDYWGRDNYAPEGSDGSRWQFKICTKGSCLRTVTGAETPPPHGSEIHKIMTEIIGEDNFYFYGRASGTKW